MNPGPDFNQDDPFSPYRPDGKLYGFICVVVTGTQWYTGLGGSIIKELAAHGAACIYACSNTSAAAPSSDAAAAAALREACPNTRIVDYNLHVASEEDTLTLIDDILNLWGRLDVWVSCSGILGPSSMAATGPEQLLRCFETNAMAPFFALKYAPAAMAKTTSKGNYPNAAPKNQKYGSIVVLSSVANTHGGCWGPALTMSSHAALGLVKSGVAVLKGTGVRINAVSAGQIDVGLSLKDSDMQGMNSQLPPSSLQSAETQKATIGLERAGSPAEVSRVVGFLASGFASYVTGASIVVDGGTSVMNPLTVPI